MKPAVPAATRFLAGKLRDDIVPHLTGFRQGNAAMTAAMLDMLADEWDVAASRLHGENAALYALVGKCAAFLGENAPAPLDQSDLRISALTATNEALRAQLIDLHAAIEENEATDLDAEIWAFLRGTVESRRVASANF
ncbi:hypothetical protein [Croceicoccus bisphenolivorans]|uniref:hypothetical protein n=1 Tax=Croceicoccus bisphenolivorans TaxID=1783232 RepID=UPI00082D949E|nr:hypothetical protein [Croceicoccus bisphenolivorans]